MAKAQAPEVKQGTNKGRRVFWVSCPWCGNGREHAARIAAKNELRDHKCDG